MWLQCFYLQKLHKLHLSTWSMKLLDLWGLLHSLPLLFSLYPTASFQFCLSIQLSGFLRFLVIPLPFWWLEFLGPGKNLNTKGYVTHNNQFAALYSLMDASFLITAHSQSPIKSSRSIFDFIYNISHLKDNFSKVYDICWACVAYPNSTVALSHFKCLNWSFISLSSAISEQHGITQ